MRRILARRRPAHDALRALGRALDLEPGVPSGWTGEHLTIQGPALGTEIRASADASVLAVGCPIETALMLCIGACEYPFVDPLLKGPPPCFGVRDPRPHETPDPQSWLVSSSGRAWLTALGLTSEDSVTVTTGYLRVRLQCRAPADDAARALAILQSRDLLPPSLEIDAEAPAQMDSAGDPEIDLALAQYATLLTSDDGRRSEAIASMSPQELQAFAEKGRLLLPRLDSAIDRLDRRETLTEAEAVIVGSLHDLAQALIEARMMSENSGRQR